VIDIKDPTAPFIVRSNVGFDRILWHEASNGLLYLARGYLGLKILDLTLDRPRLSIERLADPLSPIHLDWNAPPGTAFAVEASHDLVNWILLGRFTGDSLQNALSLINPGESKLPVFFRVPEQ
jgi:hypothetical protein